MRVVDHTMGVISTIRKHISAATISSWASPVRANKANNNMWLVLILHKQRGQVGDFYNVQVVSQSLIFFFPQRELWTRCTGPPSTPHVAARSSPRLTSSGAAWGTTRTCCSWSWLVMMLREGISSCPTTGTPVREASCEKVCQWLRRGLQTHLWGISRFQGTNHILWDCWQDEFENISLFFFFFFFFFKWCNS